MLMHFYSDSPPIVYCLFGAVGTFGTMLSAIVEAEILRMFCALGSIVSERTIRYIEVGIVLWYLVLSVGVNADFFFVGVPRPAWLDAYIIIATPIFLTTTFLYIIVQSIYLMFLTWGTHLQFRKEIGLQAGNFNFFIVLFSLDILCAVAYGILWLIGMQHTGASPNYSVLGFAFGNMVQSFSAMVLRKIRTIRSQKTAREALSIDTAVKTVKS
ncbi:hypothetical protein EDD86DRAFT_198594 [Gorgonomyces haynaldii]|nr:hypothetical protein EDD86DRAFT_198594 [Gorgonomyces haynaldii]